MKLQHLNSLDTVVDVPLQNRSYYKVNRNTIGGYTVYKVIDQTCLSVLQYKVPMNKNRHRDEAIHTDLPINTVDHILENERIRNYTTYGVNGHLHSPVYADVF